MLAQLISLVILAAAPAVLARPVVSEVDLLRYAGRWYQVYQDASDDVFESDFCVVADYGLFANGTISVRNRQRDKSVTGAYDGILGWAALNNRTGTHTADGSLSVYLQLPAPAPQGIPAPYDIIMLGPMSYGPYGAYEYAVVSDPFEISLFVLARDVKTYFQLYNATVFAQLEAWGFTHFINKPQMTVQDGCAEFSETDLDTCVSYSTPPPAFGRHRF